MSGFCGSWTIDGHTKNTEIIPRMARALPAPEGATIEAEADWGIAYKSADYWAEEGRKLCFYGRIYNQSQLEKELGSAPCSLNAAQFLALLIQRNGVENALASINGPFALIYFDGEQLFLARDHFGVQPFYYARFGKSLVFSTQLKPLTCHPEFKKAINHKALNAFFKFNFIPAPLCIYDGIHKLAAGHFVRQGNSANNFAEKEALHAYFNPVKIMRETPVADCSEAELVAQFGDQLQRAVMRRLNGEAPNLLLSGGLDSSMIAAFLAAESGTRSLTVGFDEAGFSETREAALIAQKLGIKHQSYTMTCSEALELMPEMGALYEEPYADQSQLATLLAFKKADSRFLWLGDGSDEILVGYKRQIQHEKYALDHNPLTGRISPSAFKQSPLGASAALLGLPHKGNYLERLITNPDYRHVVAKSHPFTEPGPAIDPEIYTLSNAHKRASAFDVRYVLSEGTLHKAGQIAQAMDIHTCLPFMDVELFQFIHRLPSSLLVNGNLGKIILRKALGKYFPPEWINRPKKGFTPPVGHWLQREKTPWMTAMLDKETIRKQGLLNWSKVDFYQKTLARKGSSTNRLWAILMLQSWLASNGF